jgi:hypothetical protein
MAGVAPAVACLALLGLQSCGAGNASEKSTDQRKIVVDHAAVDDWKQAVAPGLTDLNSLGEIRGLIEEGAASISPCSIDSGELLRLSAGRQWTAMRPGRNAEDLHPSVTATTARGYQAITRRLVAAGWTVTDRENFLGFDLPTGLGFDTAFLQRKVDRTTLHMTLQVFDDGVQADLGYRSTKDACRLAR